MKRMMIGLVLVVSLSTALYAATYLAFESVTVGTTAASFTSTSINATGAHMAATMAMCMVTSAAVNYRVDGTSAVTSAVTGGIPAAVGTPIYLNGNDVLNNFRAVYQTSAGGSALLNCVYSRP